MGQHNRFRREVYVPCNLSGHRLLRLVLSLMQLARSTVLNISHRQMPERGDAAESEGNCLWQRAKSEAPAKPLEAESQRDGPWRARGSWRDVDVGGERGRMFPPGPRLGLGY